MLIAGRSLTSWLLAWLLATAGLTVITLALVGAQPGPPQARRAEAVPLVVQRVSSVPVRRDAGPLPVGIAIPSIGVSSTLQHLGVSSSGELQVPLPGPRYDQAGWYTHSPRPGSVGPAVIAGHVDSAANGPSVFFRLGALRQRAEVFVGRADGSVAVFVVDSVRRYPKSEFPTQLVYGDTEGAALRLITCGGAFDRQSGHYADNVVVVAHLIRNTRAPEVVVGTSTAI